MAASGKVSYGVSAYFIRQKDRVVYLSNPESFTDFTKPPNIAASGQRYETRGVEASLRLRPHERTTVNVGASLVDAEWKELRLETFGGTLDFSGNTPAGVPRTMFTASLEQKIGLLTAGLNYERYADYAVTVDNKVKGGGYDLLNLALSYRPGKGTIEAVTLSATNLLDKEYDFIFGGNSSAYTRVPGVPFQARLSVRARF